MGQIFKNTSFAFLPSVTMYHRYVNLIEGFELRIPWHYGYMGPTKLALKVLYSPSFFFFFPSWISILLLMHIHLPIINFSQTDFYAVLASIS